MKAPGRNIRGFSFGVLDGFFEQKRIYAFHSKDG